VGDDDAGGERSDDALPKTDAGARDDAAGRDAAAPRGAASQDGAPPRAAAPRDAASTSADAGGARDAASTPSDASTSLGHAGPAPRDPSTAAAAGGTLSGVMPLASAPTYKGASGTSNACSKEYRTAGFAPADSSPKKHALFLYFAGTSSGSADDSAKYDSQAGQKVTEAMASRGFVALAVEYDNQIATIFADKTSCLYDTTMAQSLLSVACALPAVDCNLGIATWGHSQGALIAHFAANLDPRVRAVWTTGYSGFDGTKLPMSRFRTVNGEADAINAPVATANKTAGLTSTECPDDGRDQCLRADGSGWIVVRKTASKSNAADHCWFNKRSCTDYAETLEPSWVDPDSTAPFALSANADWVASTVARP
jgi:hypothetical protein